MAQNTAYHWNLLSAHLRTADDERLYAQEAAILAGTAAIAKAVKRSKVTQAEIAARLGKTPGYVSQVLNGSRNVTLRTLADFLWACGHEVRDIDMKPFGQCSMSYDAMDQWLDVQSCRRSASVETTATAAKDVPVTAPVRRRDSEAVAA